MKSQARRRFVIKVLVGAFSVILVGSVVVLLTGHFLLSGSGQNSTVHSCPSDSAQLNLNGTTYCADDVSNLIVIQDPGYAYFTNGSVTFMSVGYKTVCPSSYSGCPGNPGNVTLTQPMASAIKIEFTFPGGSSQTLGAVIGDSGSLSILAHQSQEKAGVLLIRNSSGYSTYLIVQASAST